METSVSDGKNVIAQKLNEWELDEPISEDNPSFEEINTALEYIKSIPNAGAEWKDANGNAYYKKTDGAVTVNSAEAADSTKPLTVAAAQAENLSAGCAAWVNGKLLIGTGVDVQDAYNKAYTQGIADGLSKVNVEYIYHTHKDSLGTVCTDSVIYATTAPGGCYVASGHTHNKTGTCGTTTSYRYQSHAAWGRTTDNYSGSAAHQICNGCGRGGYSWDNFNWSATCSTPCGTYTSYTCGSPVNTYKLGCGKTEESIEQAIITY